MASTAELITLLTSGAAFVTALATLWTVIELRSQRKDARKPELTPVRQAVYAKITGEEPAPLTFLWDRWSESRSKEPNGNYSIQLFNIGNGPAKDIHIAWEYQVDELVAIFNRASQQNLQDSFLQRLGTKDFFEFKSKTKRPFAVNADTNMRTECEYILPSTIANQSTPIGLPLIFMLLCSLCVGLVESHDLDLLSRTLESVGAIKLRVEYRDLADVKYEKVFECKLHLSSFTAKEIFGYLTFDRSG